jgi:thiol:disulfide interchange protein
MKSIINSYTKFLLHGLFFLPLLISAQEINWITMDEAARLQKQYPKKIIIDMYTTWCGPCRMLDRNTFSNKSLAEYVKY